MWIKRHMCVLAYVHQDTHTQSDIKTNKRGLRKDSVPASVRQFTSECLRACVCVREKENLGADLINKGEGVRGLDMLNGSKALHLVSTVI